ncbi:MAG: hypothetical protein M3Y41_00825 [Pseudomonadota bacterium]|nr:hypothetical protein [Pseudomonadota bacterium]
MATLGALFPGPRARSLPRGDITGGNIIAGNVTGGTITPLLAAAAYAALLWVWHTPAAYDATFRGWPVYWVVSVNVVETLV